MDKEIVLLIVSFVGGVAWYRILFFIIPIYFKRPFTRSILKLHWHHFHWGALLTLLGSVLLLVAENTSVFGIVLLGVGLGFIFDLFIPSLFLETDRGEEMEVYKNSLIPTIILVAVITVFIFVLNIFV